MGYYNFTKDLRNSENSVEEVSKIVTDVFGGEVTHTKDTFEYDLEIVLNDVISRLEVKEDFECKNTGNVAVEYESRGKASGIQTTKADTYVYKVHTKTYIEYLFIPVQTLKDAISNKLYFRDVTGGDWGSNTKMYLFKYNRFKELATTKYSIEAGLLPTKGSSPVIVFLHANTKEEFYKIYDEIDLSSWKLYTNFIHHDGESLLNLIDKHKHLPIVIVIEWDGTGDIVSYVGDNSKEMVVALSSDKDSPYYIEHLEHKINNIVNTLKGGSEVKE